jgi:stress-induced morphogen
MAMDAATIEAMIKQGLPDAEISIEDLRGNGEYYAAKVRSAAFQGKSRIQQHQLVYAALQGRVGEDVHSLTLTTAPL